MNEDELKVLSDDKIPESIRGTLAQSFVEKNKAELNAHVNSEQLVLEKRKLFWNTPFVAAMAGLITLTATYVFDRLNKSQDTENTITVEEFRQELKTSETRLTQQLSEKTIKTEAEIQNIAKEKEFQYEIVKTELADASKSNLERAEVLLFLARAGILNSLDDKALTEMAQEQKENPNKNVIPVLNKSIGSLAGVADISLAPWHVGVRESGNFTCNGVMIDAIWVLTTAHCVSRSAKYYSVVIGTPDLRTPGENIAISKIYIH